MAHITLAGVLLDPTGEFSVGDKVRFTHQSTTGNTMKSAVSVLKVPPNGAYSINLEYGLVLVEYNDYRLGQYRNLGIATVNATNTATSIPELLNALVPVSSAELIQFQAIQSNCVAAQNAAAASAAAALVSQNAAAASAATLDLINDPSQAYIFDTAALTASSLIEFLLDKPLMTNGRYNKSDGLGSNYLVKSASETAFDILLSDGKYAVFNGYTGMGVDSEVTVYVNATTGVDSIIKGETSGAGAFKTLQYAVDSMPYVISNKIIQLEDGTHNDNYLGFGNMERPAILFNKGKFISARTDKNGTVLSGGLVIKGNSTTPANVIIEPNDNYDYGIYNSQGQLGLQDFIIKTAVGATSVNNLLTSHRMDSYVHCVNVSLDGRAKAVTSNAMITESGGQIEFTTSLTQTDVKNCANLVRTLTSGDNIVLGGQWTLSDADTGVRAIDNSYIKLSSSSLTGQAIEDCSLNAISVLSGAVVEVRGESGTHIVIDGNVYLDLGAKLDLIYADVKGTTTSTHSSMSFNNSDYQNQITVDGGFVSFNNSDSFITGGANDSAIPVLLKGGGEVSETGTNNFVGSGGDTLNARVVTEQTVSSNGTTIIIADELNAVTRLNTSANRTGCVLPVGRYQWQTVELFSFAGSSVQIIESTTAGISDNTVKISGLSGVDEYRGIKFIWRGTRWFELSRSGAGS